MSNEATSFHLPKPLGSTYFQKYLEADLWIKDFTHTIGKHSLQSVARELLLTPKGLCRHFQWGVNTGIGFVDFYLRSFWHLLDSEWDYRSNYEVFRAGRAQHFNSGMSSSEKEYLVNYVEQEYELNRMVYYFVQESENLVREINPGIKIVVLSAEPQAVMGIHRDRGNYDEVVGELVNKKPAFGDLLGQFHAKKVIVEGDRGMGDLFRFAKSLEKKELDSVHTVLVTDKLHDEDAALYGEITSRNQAQRLADFKEARLYLDQSQDKSGKNGNPHIIIDPELSDSEIEGLN